MEGFRKESSREKFELLNSEVSVPVLDTYAESVFSVLITHATASRSTLINEEEIIKSIILNSTSLHWTIYDGRKKREDF